MRWSAGLSLLFRLGLSVVNELAFGERGTGSNSLGVDKHDGGGHQAEDGETQKNLNRHGRQKKQDSCKWAIGD